MDLEALQVCCESCAEWFTDAEVDHTTDPCPSCGGELYHAYETTTQTPYMLLKADLIKGEINMYETRIAALERQLRDDCWEE